MIHSLLLPCLALAAGEGYAGHMDNARLFIRKAYLEDAELELEAAVANPEGRLDPEAWFLLAKVRFERGDLAGARDAAGRAHTYSRDEAQLLEASSFSRFLDQNFGEVRIRSRWEGLQVHLDLELASLLFDPALKQWVESARARLAADRVMLPVNLPLPVGSYRINGEEVTVVAGATTALELRGGALSAKGIPTAQLAQGELGVGLSHWFGHRAVGHFIPSPAMHAAYSLPVSALIAGLTLDWSPRLYQPASGGVSASAAGWALGLRLGRELEHTGAVRLRISGGVRGGTFPGVEVSCLSGDPSRCSLDAPGDLMIYPMSWAWIPTGELSIDTARHRRTTSAGLGVKVLGEVAIGSLPSEGEAAFAREAPFTFQVLEGSRLWAAPGIRFLFNATLAF
ncbi:MAG: hypothetical protein JXX28_12715 [Deltaproteobacteria bacterium]|nr:hypothetical protein [Deltaproteobacteria bacterium]